MTLKDKIIVLTGATGGIGRELVEVLDKEGAQLVLVSRSEGELQNLIKNLSGKNHTYFVADLSDQEATIELGKKISQKFKTVDVLINAAGVGIYKPIEDLELKDWNNSLNINLTSQFLMIKSLLDNLKAAENSLVLSIGSGAGVIPMPGRSAYCVSKFAVRGLTLSLAKEFRGTKTDFCLITLGSTLTSFGPMSLKDKKLKMENGKAYLTPSWVAEKMVEIIKDDNREVEYKLYPGDYSSGKNI